MATFGKTTLGASFGGFGPGPWYIVGTKYNLPVAGTLTSIGLYVVTFDGVWQVPVRVRGAIYDVNRQLKGITEEFVWTDPTMPPYTSANPGLVVLPFATPLHLDAGEYYISYMCDAGPNPQTSVVSLVYFHDNATEKKTIAKNPPVAYTFPSSIDMWYDEYQKEISIFAEYTPDVPTEWYVNISVTPAGGGTTEPAVGDYGVPSGQGLTANPTPLAGYVFNHWEFDGVVATMPIPAQTVGTNHTLVAVFLPAGNAPSVTLPSSAMGVVSKELQITALPNGGSGNYVTYDWYKDGVFWQTTPAPIISIFSTMAEHFALTVAVTDDLSQTSTQSNACTITIAEEGENPTLEIVGGVVAGALVGYVVAKIV